MGKILDKILGNKVVLVEGYELYGHARIERTFAFNPLDKKVVTRSLKSIGYSVISIKTKRTKKHTCPPEGKFKPITKKNVVCFYD